MTQVKICGMTNLDDARIAVEAGADLLGFIFYEPSPRYVTPNIVREIVLNLRQQMHDLHDNESHRQNGAPAVRYIGVFVDTPVETVEQLLDFCQLDAAQLHGNVSPAEVALLQGRAFKALQPSSLEEAAQLVQKYDLLRPSSTSPTRLPHLLLDAYHPTLYGGTGQVADWSMAAAIASQYPIMLAGSLTPDNVVAAIQAVKPWGVDVSSGVEAAKGQKDHEKVKAFIHAVKNVSDI